LIPLPWLGPVIAPILVSLTMIGLSTNLLFLDEYNGEVRVKFAEWLLLLAGAGLVFISFIWNYSVLLVQAGFGARFWNPAMKQHFLNLAYSYYPGFFNWPVFFLGLGAVLLGTALILVRLHPIIRDPNDFIRDLRQDVRSYLSKILPV
jgi:di/tricarboxylate transporter